MHSFIERKEKKRIRREKISEGTYVRRQVKGGAAQVDEEEHPVRSVHYGIVVEQSVTLLSLQ